MDCVPLDDYWDFDDEFDDGIEPLFESDDWDWGTYDDGYYEEEEDEYWDEEYY